MREYMKKIMTMLALLICMALLIVGCGSPRSSISSKEDTKDTTGESGQIDSEDSETEDASETDKASETEDAAETDKASETEDAAEDTEEVVSTSSKPTTIVEFSDLWSNLYEGNEQAINNYEGVIFELIMPATSFITGIQYDLLNINNENGRYEGELMFAGYKGFVEKNGSDLTFGYDTIREEDGFSPNMLTGDRIFESGNCDLDAVYYYVESYTERSGSKIDRQVSEFRQEKDGSISCFTFEGYNRNSSNEEDPQTTFVYIRNGKNQYDFVIAKAAVGTEFEIVTLKDYEDMTKEQAIKLFEGAGFTIERTGGIKDAILVID